MGHLRDQADWTAYLYSLMLWQKEQGELEQKLGYEGGRKILKVQLPPDITDLDMALLAGNIAYDLSIWHEIATWFGASYLPFIPERYSSFSVEDNYSNLLGVIIGIEALQSSLPYEEAMTLLIKQKLVELQAAQNEEETYTAMNSVEGLWWTNQAKLPGGKVLKKRNLDISTQLKPWLVEGQTVSAHTAEVLNLKLTTQSGIPLEDLYEIHFRLNHKFPVKELFPKKIGRNITQKDFDFLMLYVKKDIKTRYGNTQEKSQKSKIYDN